MELGLTVRNFGGGGLGTQAEENHYSSVSIPEDITKVTLWCIVDSAARFEFWGLYHPLQSRVILSLTLIFWLQALSNGLPDDFRFTAHDNRNGRRGVGHVRESEFLR